jgi:lipopolysaccharide export system protein LptA
MMRILAFTVSALAILPAMASAQSLSFTSKDPSRPIEVTANQGIEWQQNGKLFIARGSAKAKQDDLSVMADELTAHYRENKSGGSEVYRVDAIGNVTIASSSEKATGSSAVYDFDKGVLVLAGGSVPVTLTTNTGKVTAEDTIQYWSKEKVAVAQGNAEAQDDTRRIKADRITAYFSDPPPAKANDKNSMQSGEIRLVQGEGNVVLRTQKETVKGSRGEYNRQTGIAKVEGNVQMVQGQNTISGGFAVVDTKAGTSRLFGSAAEAKTAGPQTDTRVKALIAPRPQSATESMSETPAETPKSSSPKR